MKVVVLASGSKGNATYIETKNTKVLIDAGISLLQMRNHLSLYGIKLSVLDAVFVTHEHTDHIHYLQSILAKTNATLYINELTLDDAERKLRTGLKQYPHAIIKPNDGKHFYTYRVGDLMVLPLRLSHDTQSCMGYCFRDMTEKGNVTYASVTDTGYLPVELYKILASTNTILLESNYDEEMLMNSSRPYDLKMRIKGDHGHLCNVDSSAHLRNFVSEDTKRIILGHISEECNTPEKAMNEVNKAFDGEVPFILECAKQHEPLYFEVEDNND